MSDFHNKKEYLQNADTLVPNEKGILVDSDFLLKKPEAGSFDEGNQATIDGHNKARRAELRAPNPGIRVPFSAVLCKAARPKLINTLAHTANLVNIRIEGDEKFRREADTMVRVIYNEQEIIAVGSHVDEKNFKPGDLVKINFRRFLALRDTNVENPNGEYSKEIDVPVHTINGHDYIIIDQRDIEWAYEENHQLKDLEGYEHETV